MHNDASVQWRNQRYRGIWKHWQTSLDRRLLTSAKRSTYRTPAKRFRVYGMVRLNDDIDAAPARRHTQIVRWTVCLMETRLEFEILELAYSFRLEREPWGD